eukprot:m.210174 g.210174  ORF g.210174 m.210174 type:complete len:148 (-) comp15820_c0_seq56:446-889(-)
MYFHLKAVILRLFKACGSAFCSNRSATNPRQKDAAPIKGVNMVCGAGMFGSAFISSSFLPRSKWPPRIALSNGVAERESRSLIGYPEASMASTVSVSPSNVAFIIAVLSELPELISDNFEDVLDSSKLRVQLSSIGFYYVIQFNRKE